LIPGVPTNVATTGNHPGFVGNPTAILQLGAAVTPGAGKTLTINMVSSPQGTNVFSLNTFFLVDRDPPVAGATGKSTAVTCLNNNAAFTQFLNCTGVPATVNNSTITTSYVSPQNTDTIGGWIKIERQDADSTWHDVTMEILNYGIGAPNVWSLAADDHTAVAAGGQFACPDPNPNAIVRLQRLHDNGIGSAAC